MPFHAKVFSSDAALSTAGRGISDNRWFSLAIALLAFPLSPTPQPDRLTNPSAPLRATDSRMRIWYCTAYGTVHSPLKCTPYIRSSPLKEATRTL